jgi:hypothetical protein
MAAPVLPLTMSQTTPKKNYALLALAILLLLLGGVGLYLGTDNFQIRTLGLAAIMASTYFIRISRVRERSNFPLAQIRDSDVTKTPGIRRRLWILSIAMLPLFGVALLLLYIDAVNGYHEVWPVYAFAGVGLVCAGVWSCLAGVIAGSK